jgi:hypothetical protein
MNDTTTRYTTAEIAASLETGGIGMHAAVRTLLRQAHYSSDDESVRFVMAAMRAAADGLPDTHVVRHAKRASSLRNMRALLAHADLLALM